MPNTAAKLQATRHSDELIGHLFELIFDDSPYLVAVCDRELRFVRVNNAWATLDGIPPEDHVGKTAPEVLGVSNCPVDIAMKQVFATGEPIFDLKFGAKLPTRPEVAKWFVGLFPMPNERGEVTHVGSITFDITSKAAAKFQSFFVAHPAHDLWTPAQRVDGDKLKLLTKREIEVTRLVAQGKSNKEVGSALGTAERTVESQRRVIMQKLGIHTLAELVLFAVRNKLVTP